MPKPNIDVVVGAVDDPHLAENTFDAVLIYNAYHEMTAPEPILKAIFKALKPGGRLVMSEPLHDNVRSATRAEQVKEHEIGPNFVEQELRVTGFEVIEERPDFLAFTSPGHKGGCWLIVARKPSVRRTALVEETTMACSCCAFGDTADQHFNAETVARNWHRTVERDQDPQRGDCGTDLHLILAAAILASWLWPRPAFDDPAATGAGGPTTESRRRCRRKQTR